jgi:hypothetical protein
VDTRCVALESEQVTGADLLDSSGLEVVADTSSGMGITVCQIEGEGCAYPSERCFCQCSGGGECGYWNYFYREPGDEGWTYSPLGAVLRKVQDGSVEAWVWGDGRTPPGDDFSFESVCVPPDPTATDAPTPDVAAPITATFTPAGQEPTVQPPTSTARIPATTTSSPTATTTPALVTQTDAGLPVYWPFVLMVAGLAAAGILVRIRRS